jgi:hypothetical protein
VFEKLMKQADGPVWTLLQLQLIAEAEKPKSAAVSLLAGLWSHTVVQLLLKTSPHMDFLQQLHAHRRCVFQHMLSTRLTKLAGSVV